jgi:pyrroline-5-carboxylate reductase
MKVVLITGASQGIGYFTAERLAQKGGYQVIATARDLEKDSQLSKLAQTYPNVFLRKLDVTDSEQNIKQCIDNIGRIDILINNAGIGLAGCVESCSIEQMQKLLDTNVLGVMKVIQAVLPGMRTNNCGLILTISSIVGPLPSMRQPVYSASKAMLEHLTAGLRNDLQEAGYKIRVANIHPGPVSTNIVHATPTGNHFIGKTNPYPQMQKNNENWRFFMEKGHFMDEAVEPILSAIQAENPNIWNITKEKVKKNLARISVDETVNTILSVIQAENPNFWNPTEDNVRKNFARVYVDETGEQFAKGPVFPSLSENKTLSIIGAGHLGSAFLQGFLQSGRSDFSIFVSQSNLESTKRKASSLKIFPAESNNHAVEVADIVILAVKPQLIPSICQEIAKTVQNKRPLIISLAGVIPIKQIEHWLGVQNLGIVRVMTNTPMAYCKGISALYANAHLTKEQAETCIQIFNQVGHAFWVNEEFMLDKLTASIGCSPAYVFLFMEALQKAAQSREIPEDLARMITIGIFSGSVELATYSDNSFHNLGKAVKTPNGITAHSLKTFPTNTFFESFEKIYAAAEARIEQMKEGPLFQSKL